MTLFLAKIKPWILPIAMVCGILFHNVIDAVQFMAPYLIFAMLLITFCRIGDSKLKFGHLTWSVVAVQIFGGILVYYLLAPLSEDLGQGTMICVLCPTATAAPVITAMLGGSIAVLISISLLSNLALSLVGPVFLAYINESQGIAISFVDSFIAILSMVAPMIIGPLAVALILRRITPKVHRTLAEHQSLSFFLWAISLILVVGRAVTFAMAEPADRIPEMIWLSVGAGAVCAAQFYVGRKLGTRMGDRIAGAQGLGQKNTVLAVWLATTYLNPISSIAPAAYIAWQNTINSLQIYRKQKRELASRAA